MKSLTMATGCAALVGDALAEGTAPGDEMRTLGEQAAYADAFGEAHYLNLRQEMATRGLQIAVAQGIPKPKLDTCGIENGTKSENRFTLDFRPSRTRPSRFQLVPIRPQIHLSA